MAHAQGLRHLLGEALHPPVKEEGGGARKRGDLLQDSFPHEDGVGDGFTHL